MGNFRRDDRKSGGGFSRGFGGSKRFGDRHVGGNTMMHDAICSECGNDCQVPFKPTGSKPVFCSNCFDKKGGGNSRPNKFDGARHDRPSFGDKQMHNAICAKCGDNCQVPFRPMAGKPVYCSNCFDKHGQAGGRSSGQSFEELKVINAKLDMIMNALGLSGAKKNEKPVEKVTAKKEVIEKKTKKVVAKKPVAKKKASTKKKK